MAISKTNERLDFASSLDAVVIHLNTFPTRPKKQ